MNFNFMGSRWSEIVPEENEDMKKNGYVVIKRKPTYWGLKRGGGQMVTGQSVRAEDLPERVRPEALAIIRQY